MSIWLMQLGGFLSWDGAYYSQGTGGMYWSSFTNNAAYAYILTGSSLGYDDESRGNTVRCIAN